MNKKITKLVLATTMLISFQTTNTLQAKESSDTSPEISNHKATINKLKNLVQFKYENNLWNKAKVNQVIIPLTSIRTGFLSKAEIIFSDGTITNVGSRTIFTFLDKQKRSVNVQQGKIWFSVNKKSYGLKIYSPSAVAAITGTEGFLEFSENMKKDDETKNETNFETYTVKSGDTLIKISTDFLGNKASNAEINNFIDQILNLNPDIIKNKNLIHKGNKIIINKTTFNRIINNNPDKSDSQFSIGLIEGSSDVFKTAANGEPTGDAQRVKEGEVLTLKGGKFSVQNIDTILNIPKNMTIVRGGSFKMGGDGETDEKPIHEVNVSSFYIGKYEVTQSEYKALMEKNPSIFTGDNLPVETVSWWDAIKYCNKKSLKENLPVAYNEKTGELLDSDGKITTDIREVVGYRLPTEAEWEYASKGANKPGGYMYSGSNSVEDVAWYGYKASGKTTHPVGNKAPNEIGAFDMSGNVSEWVYDSYISDAYKNSKNNENPFFTMTKPGSFRVYRGGSWNYLEKHQSVFSRSGYIPEYKGENIGFRIAKNISF